MTEHLVNSPLMNWEAEDLDREFRRFKQHCNFVFKGPLEQKSEIVKCNYLMSFIGDRGRDIYMTFTWTPAIEAVLGENEAVVTPGIAAENETLEGIFAKFENYVAPKRNQIRATVVFNRRKQNETERFDGFVTDLRRLVKDCGFGQMEDRMLRDAIVLRAYHAKVREKCLDKGDELTLQMAVTYGQSYEASRQSLKMIEERKSLTGDDAVNKVDAYHRISSKGYTNRTDGETKENQCKHCGKRHTGVCKFKNAKCYKCQKVGHIKPVCGKFVNHIEEETLDKDGSVTKPEEDVKNVKEKSSSDAAMFHHMKLM